MMERLIKYVEIEIFGQNLLPWTEMRKSTLVYIRDRHEVCLQMAVVRPVYELWRPSRPRLLICSAWHDGTYHKAMWRSIFSAKICIPWAEMRKSTLVYIRDRHEVCLQMAVVRPVYELWRLSGGLGMLICSVWHDGTYHKAMWRSKFSAKICYHEQKCENLPWCIFATGTKFAFRWLLCGLCMSYEDYSRPRHAYMQCLTWWNAS